MILGSSQCAPEINAMLMVVMCHVTLALTSEHHQLCRVTALYQSRLIIKSIIIDISVIHLCFLKDGLSGASEG